MSKANKVISIIEIIMSFLSIALSFAKDVIKKPVLDDSSKDKDESDKVL